MTLEENFIATAKRSLLLPQKPSPTDLQLLYGLYKQATLGDNPHEKPNNTDMVSMGKHLGWKAQKGKAKEKAMEEYIAKVEALEAAQNS